MTFRSPRAAMLAAAAALLAAACGGGGNPLSNPPDILNPAGTGGEKLSFAYFQACINPIFEKLIASGNTVNKCSSGGCHDNVSGTGGALRLAVAPASLDVLDPANTPDVIRQSDMYKNFYSAQGAVVIGAPTQSRLFQKPLVLNVLHGGGQIFIDANDPNAKLIQYWITHPAPQGQDEFSRATDSMFTPPNPNTGACNTTP